MDLRDPFMLIMALLSIGVPILGTIAIWGSIHGVSSYVRGVFSKNVGWGSPDPGTSKLALSLTPWAFGIVGIACVFIALVVEMVLALALMGTIGDDPITSFILVVSAGPIEETSKFAVALTAFALLHLFLGSRAGRDPVKDGILVGLFVGCSFGFVESIGYLVIGFSDILSAGPSYATVDPVLWRIVLGVAIHGMYAAIAAVGLGRARKREIIAWTAIGLSVAVMLHSLNNGVQGLFILILEMDSVPVLIAIDAIQAILIVIGALFLFFIWRSRVRIPAVR